MIAFTCSGTGGHIYPAIAVAQKIGHQKSIFIIEKDRLAASVIPKYGFNCAKINFKLKYVFSWIPTLLTVISILRKHDVTKLISTGGYATLPVVIAAWLLRIPVTLLEQNSIPGRANRFLAFFATKICISFDYSKSYFKHKHVYLTGNPIRQVYPKDPLVEKLLALHWGKGKNLLIFGGSQGAESINNTILNLKLFFKKESINVIHIVGRKYYDQHFSNDSPIIEKDQLSNCIYAIVDYVENMDKLYQWTDFVISRAGATSIAELLFYQKPALLIPYPYATDNHQEYNADELIKLGLAQKTSIDTISEQYLKAFFSSDFKINASSNRNVNLDTIIN
ncbi:MAG: hypothetical protein CMP39_03530 [Rickettsiales bacterium]|nr:hypothetical protein [Rickettsiales bacterium]